MKRSAWALVALFLAVPAMAETPSYNFVEFGYQRTDLDVGGGADFDGDGFAIGGSFSVADQWFVFADYASADFDFNVDATEWQAGLGYRIGISDNTDVYAKASYVNAEIDVPGSGSFDDSGFGLGIGVRGNLTPVVELYAEIGYVDIGDSSNTAFGAGGWYSLSENFAVGAGFATDDDITSYGVAGRYYFDL